MPTIKPLTKEEVLEKIDKGESFKGVEIGDVDFDGFSFYEPVNFDGAVFKGEVNFTFANFKDVYFRNAKFEGKTDFSGSNFEGKTSFDSTNFEGITYFTYAKFEREAYFDFANFEGEIFFFVTTFKNVSFMYVKFKGITYFSSTKFEGVTSFDSTFRNIVHFRYTRFNGITSFNNTVFEDRAFFIGKREENNKCFYKFTDWNNVEFLKPKLINFTSVDFSKCKLSNTDLSSVNLVDIHWARKSKRRVIYDEIEFEIETKKKKEKEKDKEKKNDKNIDYPIVENAYRRLKKNYENSGNYPFAGDFHYGEMEMKRLAQNKFFRWFSLTTLYKIFSGYGEKLWRSLLWLVLFFLFFTFSYLFTGLQSGSLLSESGKHEIIEYNFMLDLHPDSIREFFNDSYTALSHSVEVIIFRREKLYETFTDTGRIFEFLQFVLVMFFVTLSIMAIKRKFRR